MKQRTTGVLTCSLQEVKEEMIKPVGYTRSEGMIHFLIPARFYFYQGLVHTYPNIFENGDFFSIYISKKHESRGSVLNCFSSVQTKVQIR